MDSRLNRIGDWETLARRAEYCATALADSVGVTDRHLRRFFQATFERTPQQYLNDLRLREAREALDRGVCVRCASVFFGYAHVSGFSRAFKEAFGAPPSTVSRRHSGDLPGASTAGSERKPPTRTD